MSKLGAMEVGVDGSGIGPLVKRPSMPRRLVIGLTIATAAFWLGMVAPSAGAANLTRSYTGASFGPDGTAATEFAHPGAVAVDPVDHDVYVADTGAGRVYRFDSEGHPADFGTSGSNSLSGFNFNPAEAGASQIAIDDGHGAFYVADLGSNSVKGFGLNGSPRKFAATKTNELTGLGGEVCGVAVDSEGDIYVGTFGVVKIFDRTGALLTEFAAAEGCNLAVNGEGDVYVETFSETEGLLKFVPGEFPVKAGTTYTSAGVIDKARSFGLAIDPATEDVYADEGSRVSQFDSAGTRVGAFGDFGPGVLSGSEGVGVGDGSAYATEASSGQVEIFGPSEPAATRLEGARVTAVGTETAEFSVRANPEGTPARVSVEYSAGGPCEAVACTRAPEVQIGQGSVAETVKVVVTGLTPGTTYHFKGVATDAAGSTVHGDDQTFHTFPFTEGGPTLPDGRVYELVSPGEKNSAEVGLPSSRSNAGGLAFYLRPQLSAPDGNAVTFQSFTAFGSAPGAPGASQYLAVRTPEGWLVRNITPPDQLGLVEGPVKAFSTDLTRSIDVISARGPLLAPGANAGSLNAYEARLPESGFESLINEPPRLNDPAQEPLCFGFEGASADLGKVVFLSNGALTADATVPGQFKRNLYEWSRGSGARLLTILPDGSPGQVTSYNSVGYENGDCAVQTPISKDAVSEDGSHVFWTYRPIQSNPEDSTLYVRIDGNRTVQIDAAQNGSSAGGQGHFWTASSNGERVFFTDPLPLTPDSSEAAPGFPRGDLYEYDVGNESLIDLTPASTGASAETLGVVGAGEDGEDVYFAALGALTDGERNEAGETAQEGEPNLYLERQHRLYFIATLTEADEATWSQEYGQRTSRVSPNGKYLTFLSRKSLTGFDSTIGDGDPHCQSLNGEPYGPAACDEVFLYSAEKDSMVCASCSPSGAAPSGPPSPLRDSLSEGGGNDLAHWRTPTEQPRFLADDGRVFFESFDALLPQDTDRTRDVYEYEPDGVGSCSAASQGFSGNSRGCVALISSGKGPDESFFFDATPGGEDVFIATRSRLLDEDVNDRFDIYDARVGGGLPRRLPAGEPCGDESSCRGAAAAAPSEATPATAAIRSSAPSPCMSAVMKARGASRRARVVMKRSKRVGNAKHSARLRARAGKLRRTSRRLHRRASRCMKANRRTKR